MKMRQIKSQKFTIAIYFKKTYKCLLKVFERAVKHVFFYFREQVHVHPLKLKITKKLHKMLHLFIFGGILELLSTLSAQPTLYFS